MASPWMHCNNCYFQPSREHTRAFFMTSCGHLFCSKCVEASTQRGKQCSKCKSSPCQVLEVNRNMNPKYQEFFTNPGDVLKSDFEKSMQKMKQVLKFQSTHRVNIGLIIKDQMRKAEKLQQAYAAEKNRIKELQTEYKTLRANIEAMQRELDAAPLSQPSPTTANPLLARLQIGSPTSGNPMAAPIFTPPRNSGFTVETPPQRISLRMSGSETSKGGSGGSRSVDRSAGSSQYGNGASAGSSQFGIGASAGSLQFGNCTAAEGLTTPQLLGITARNLRRESPLSTQTGSTVRNFY